MFLLLCVITIVLFLLWLYSKILCSMWDNLTYEERKSLKMKKRWNLKYCDGGLLGAAIIMLIVTGTIGLILALSFNPGVDKKIAMYQEENAIIEEQISILVQNYMEYEKGILLEVEPESYIQLVSLYPELSADELVKTQINIYTENSIAIKKLKNSAINQSYWRWWLYFGN